MTADRYPHAAWEPVSYVGDASALINPLGWVEHVQAGDSDPFSTFESAVSPNRRFSHLWVSKGGRVVQYQSLNRDSWAQGGGNGFTPGTGYWAVETEGFPDEALTPEQITALGTWHAWSGTANAVANAPGERGIGTHSMGGAAWGDHPGCPGPIRAAQRPAIIAAAQGGDMPLTEAEWTRLSALLDSKAATYADAVENRYGVKLADGTVVNRDVEEAALDAMLRQVLAKVSLGAGGPVDVQALATALAPVLSKAEADELARRLTA